MKNHKIMDTYSTSSDEAGHEMSIPNPASAHKSTNPEEAMIFVNERKINRFNTILSAANS